MSLNAPSDDLPQIRGDWAFHMNYVANAVTQTINRQVKNWDALGMDNDAVDASVRQQSQLWEQLAGDLNELGTIKPENSEDFCATCRGAKDMLDQLEVDNGAGGSGSFQDTPLEQFTEAARQLRGLCDDLDLLKSIDRS